MNHCKEKPNLLRIGRGLSFRGRARGFYGRVRGFHEEKSRDPSQVCQKIQLINMTYSQLIHNYHLKYSLNILEKAKKVEKMKIFKKKVVKGPRILCEA